MKTLRNLGYFNIVVSLPLCYFFFTNWYFWLLPAGVALVLVTHTHRRGLTLSVGWQRFIGLLPLLATSGVLAGTLAWTTRPFRQTILIPANYRGVVVIGYDVPNGQAETWEGDNRLIRVSPQGIAATQFKLVEGDRSPEYDKIYRVTPNNERQLVRELLSQSPPKPGDVGVRHAYLESSPNTLVCLVARADSVTHYLDPESFTLRPVYAQKAMAMTSLVRP